MPRGACCRDDTHDSDFDFTHGLCTQTPRADASVGNACGVAAQVVRVSDAQRGQVSIEALPYIRDITASTVVVRVNPADVDSLQGSLTRQRQTQQTLAPEPETLPVRPQPPLTAKKALHPSDIDYCREFCFAALPQRADRASATVWRDTCNCVRVAVARANTAHTSIQCYSPDAFYYAI